MEEALLWFFTIISLVRVHQLMRKKKENRRKWSRKWLLKRSQYSHINLLKELSINDNNDWRNYLRMDATTYNRLLELVTPFIKKDDTCMRKAISSHERLSATLRFLATERSYKDLEFTTIVSKSSLSRIIPETCNAIYQVLKKDYLKVNKY